jgi:cytochrome P450
MSSTQTLPDIGSMDFWTRDRVFREAAFAWLRRHEPVSWHGPAESLLLPPELNTKGFWAITKLEHIREISRQPKIFSNADGVFMEDLPPAGVAALSFLAQDAPSHTQLRGIIQTALGPRNMRKMESWIGGHARQAVAELAPRGEGDLVKELAKPLPGAIYAHYIGVESVELRDRVIWAADQLVSWADPEYTERMSPAEVFMGAAKILSDTALELAEQRRRRPGDDMVTWVVQAEFDGRKMTDHEIGAFFVLLGGAANDTTGHTIANSLIALQEFPDQRTLLLDDFDGRIDSAIEEFLRFRPPVMHFRRTARADYQIAGKTIRTGDKVVLWYVSGCRDEDVFDEPDRLDILRDNSDRHIAFGGGGPHFCIGNALGRAVLKAAIREVYRQLPELRLGDPQFYPSNFMNNVRRLPATWSAR